MSGRGQVTVDELLVVVPARDEAERVSASIAAVVAAVRAADLARSTVVVVDDGSTDDTGRTARRALAHGGIPGVVVRTDRAQAAAARNVGVRHGMTRHDPARTWLLSTDADCIVPTDWVVRHLDHARRGEVAVAGIVSLLDDEDGRRVAATWELEYGSTLREDGTHPHVHAANLGIRLDVHLAHGGFAEIDRIEDIDLWRRLRTSGHTPVADRSIVVATSARRQGRVERGFAHALALLVTPASEGAA